MKWTKIMLLAVTAVALAGLGTGCAYFDGDETAKPFFRKGAGGASGHGGASGVGGIGGSGAGLEGGGIGGPGGIGGGGDVSGIGGQPGAYQQGAGVGANDYDGFGTPIPGVQFQPLYFKFDQAIVDPDEAAKVDAVVKYLQSNPGTGVVIEGNCDTRGTNEYNRALGERRALAAQEMMVGAGIDASRIKTLSYGEEKVAVQGETEEAHAQNRRDEFVAVKLAK